MSSWDVVGELPKAQANPLTCATVARKKEWLEILLEVGRVCTTVHTVYTVAHLITLSTRTLHIHSQGRAFKNRHKQQYVLPIPDHSVICVGILLVMESLLRAYSLLLLASNISSLVAFSSHYTNHFYSTISSQQRTIMAATKPSGSFFNQVPDRRDNNGGNDNDDLNDNSSMESNNISDDPFQESLTKMMMSRTEIKAKAPSTIAGVPTSGIGKNRNPKFYLHERN